MACFVPIDEMSIAEFGSEAGAFIDQAKERGVTCEAYGAILPPSLYEPAMRWQRYCYDNHMAGIHWPGEHGGRGLSRAHNTAWYEQCAQANVAPHLNLQGIVLAGEAILRAGTDAQRLRFLGPTLSNEILWCQLFSEPGAGSDLGALQTRAELDGDVYRLNGQKVWSSNAQFAQYAILMARTNGELPKHKGISFFLLDMTLPGIEVRPLKQMTGDQEFCEVFFDDVAMPTDALLGDLNGGWAVAMAVLEDERAGAGSAQIISLDMRLNAMAVSSTDLDPLSRQALTSLLSRGKALRSLMQLRGDDPRMAPISKLMQSEMGYDEAQLDAELQGPSSMLLCDITERLLYSPGMRLAGGSSEIQRNIIGERLLGLPREPQV